jgi:hypothetical protein
MISSAFLANAEISALERVGDIYIPGDATYPSFSALGCMEHVDLLLESTEPADLKRLRMLLRVLGVAPTSMIRWMIRRGENAYSQPGVLAGLFREFEFGLGGLVKSLYFSGRRGIDYRGRTPPEIIGYSGSISSDA